MSAIPEIPAADFDFDQIKAGDEVFIKFKVLADGLTREHTNSDRFVQVQQPDFGPYFYRPSAFHSVIPAPKLKTLRERAIEAVAQRIPEIARADGPGWMVEAAVDAVLTEVAALQSQAPPSPVEQKEG